MDLPGFSWIFMDFHGFQGLGVGAACGIQWRRSHLTHQDGALRLEGIGRYCRLQVFVIAVCRIAVCRMVHWNMQDGSLEGIAGIRDCCLQDWKVGGLQL